LNTASRTYKIHEKELHIIAEAFREWKKDLTGEEKQVLVYTDP